MQRLLESLFGTGTYLYIGEIFVLGTLLALGQLMMMMKRNQTSHLANRVVAMVVFLTSGVLYIPLLSCLAILLVSGNAADLLLSIVLMPCFIAMSTCVIGSIYSINPLSLDPLARAHSRIEFVYHLEKTVICIIVNLIGSGTVVALVALALATACGYLYSSYMPFFNIRVNYLRALCSWVFAWASLSACVAVTFNDSSVGGPLFMLVGGSPIIIVAAFLLIRDR